MRIHRFLPSSRANGPGNRAVIWVQGCSLGCPGCFNPETHRASGGRLISPEALLKKIAASGDAVEGITISGGEPFQQAGSLGDFLRRLRETTDLSVVVFTGYDRAELAKIAGAEPALRFIDVLIAGRYRADRRVAHGLQGSANKRFHFLTRRYRRKDFQVVPDAELLIAEDGSLTVTGINPPDLGTAFVPRSPGRRE